MSVDTVITTIIILNITVTPLQVIMIAANLIFNKFIFFSVDFGWLDNFHLVVEAYLIYDVVMIIANEFIKFVKIIWKVSLIY